MCDVFLVLAGKLDGLGWDGLVVYPLRAWRDGGFWCMVPVQIAVALPKRDDVTVRMCPSLCELQSRGVAVSRWDWTERSLWVGSGIVSSEM